jgi:hypothetical protein
MPPLPRCCRAASVALPQPLPPSCLTAVSLRFRRFPLSAAAVLPPPPPSAAVAAPPSLCLCRAGSAALPLCRRSAAAALPLCRRSAAAALPLTPPCCRCAAAAALPPCRRLCAAAAALVQTLPLPCCLRRHRSAAASDADVPPPCRHNHELMLCAEHASHSHLSNLPIYMFCAADSRTIQNQNFICHPIPPPFSLCHPPRVHPSF